MGLIARRSGAALVAATAVLAACSASDGPQLLVQSLPPAVVTPVPHSPAGQAAVATTEPVATPTPAPTPTAVPSATPEPVREITLAFTGDLLSHVPVFQTAAALGSPEPGGGALEYDYRPMFRNVAARIGEADLAVCVLETPLSADNDDLSGYPSFNAPADLADAIAATGWDGCSTASNHSLDRGPNGVGETLDALDRVGVAHAGMARSAEEQLEPTIYSTEVGDVAHLSWTYGLNGYVRPDGADWLVNVNDVDLILAEAARARAAGADIVVLSIQWGAEYQTDPTADQQQWADQLTASPDIDLIVGNHAHVVQPIAEVNGKLVLYGLGNFLSNQPAPGYRAATQDGIIAEVRFRDDGDGWRAVDVTVVPTWVDKDNAYTVVRVAQELATLESGSPRWVELEESLTRTVDALTRLGYQPIIE